MRELGEGKQRPRRQGTARPARHGQRAGGVSAVFLVLPVDRIESSAPLARRPCRHAAAARPRGHGFPPPVPSMAMRCRWRRHRAGCTCVRSRRTTMPVRETEIRLGVELKRAPATALGVGKRRARTGAPVTAGARAVDPWWVGVRATWCGPSGRPNGGWARCCMLLLLCCRRHEEEEKEEAGPADSLRARSQSRAEGRAGGRS